MRFPFTMTTNLLICLLAVALQACSPDPPDCLETKYGGDDITPQEHAAVPYSGTDTLRFLTETGDTNIFIGSGKTYFYERYLVPSSTPGCPSEEVYDNQAYKVQYTSTKQQMNFELTLSTKEPNGEFVAITFNSIERFYRLRLYRIFQKIDPIPIDTNYYFERITLLGTEYTDVRKTPSRVIAGIERIDSLGYMLYNKEEGIIQVKLRYQAVNQNQMKMPLTTLLTCWIIFTSIAQNLCDGHERHP